MDENEKLGLDESAREENSVTISEENTVNDKQISTDNENVEQYLPDLEQGLQVESVNEVDGDSVDNAMTVAEEDFVPQNTETDFVEQETEFNSPSDLVENVEDSKNTNEQLENEISALENDASEIVNETALEEIAQNVRISNQSELEEMTRSQKADKNEFVSKFENNEIITSLDNSSVKLARSLLQRKNRKFYGSFLVEGENLVKEAIFSSGGLEKIFVDKSYLEKYDEMLNNCACPVVVVSSKVLESLSDTITPQGIVAQVQMIPSMEFIPTRPFLVLDNLQDPGNMGTIIRTAVAIGSPDIVLINTVDVHNPKVIRASVGTIFKANFYPLSAEELVEMCEKYRFQLVTTDMYGNNVFDDPPIEERYALVIGNEGNGVQEFLMSHSDLSISLPMENKVESLNAGVSASVIMYLLKQKNYKKGDK